ncbi:MAG TPA: bifunctional DNA-formamidopyrimidine glycosylase/DNA-(apurinic or apyrimidinic site) lyase [Phycisphaeraceae bacterium]
MFAVPELPEVENVRRTLALRIVNRPICAVEIRRASVIHGPHTPRALLADSAVARVERHGKQLALIGPSGQPCLGIHLGMTGSLRHTSSIAQQDQHVHVAWRLDDGSWMIFRDPRRFGGIWAFPSFQALQAGRWAKLGPDALSITPADLHRRLQRTRQAIKAALLDQHLLAGLGNIYADELLFACRLWPLTPACRLSLAQTQQLVRAMRRLLARAIRAGGSTLRDYVNAQGQPGGFQLQHRVYNRAGQPCTICKGPLTRLTLAGRTTVCCPRCQPNSR